MSLWSKVAKVARTAADWAPVVAELVRQGQDAEALREARVRVEARRTEREAALAAARKAQEERFDG